MMGGQFLAKWNTVMGAATTAVATGALRKLRKHVFAYF